jgi:molybdenum cofactor synthesis domain-containing protein
VRPFAQTIPFAEALRLTIEAAVPLEGIEHVSLADAAERVLAQDITSSIDVPPFDRAAMDGYAVRADDTTGASPAHPVRLRSVDRLFTGRVSARAVGPNECMEIATGAPLPPGATGVVMVERTVREGDDVRLAAPVAAGEHVGRRAADLARDEIVLRRGDLLTPSRLGAVAAVGCASVDVFARPSVAILSSGDEIAEPGTPLAPGRIYDVNRFTLAAVTRQHGGAPHTALPVADRVDVLIAALEQSRAHDIAICSGGSSVGDRDLTVDAIRACGEVIFHGIAVKPGKPTLLGRVGTTLVFGMPGNPASCLSNAYMLLVPALRRMAHLPPWRPEPRTMPLSRRVTSAPGRHQFYTVRIVDGRAEPAFKGSGDITSMARADGYIEIAADVDAVEAGTLVDVRLF